jgi:hypothetical protein
MSKFRLLVFYIAIGVLAFSWFGTSTQAQMPAGSTPVASAQTEGINVDLSTLQSKGVPLRPLPDVPKDLEVKIIKAEKKCIGCSVMFEHCRATPGGAIVNLQIGAMCEELSRTLASFVVHDHDGWNEWFSKHGYIRITEKLMDSARMRACALGRPLGCYDYGKSLMALGNLDAARLVWKSDPRINNQSCQETRMERPVRP